MGVRFAAVKLGRESLLSDDAGTFSTLTLPWFILAIVSMATPLCQFNSHCGSSVTIALTMTKKW